MSRKRQNREIVFFGVSCPSRQLAFQENRKITVWNQQGWKGRTLDRIVIESFRSVLNAGAVFLKEYENFVAASWGINRYLLNYISGKPYDSPGKRTMDENKWRYFD